MLEDEAFIKFLLIDGLAARAIMACEVTTPAHEVLESFCEGRNQVDQILSPRCSEHASFPLPLELCKQLKLSDILPKGSPSTVMSEHTVMLTVVGSRQLQGTACLTNLHSVLSKKGSGYAEK